MTFASPQSRRTPLSVLDQVQPLIVVASVTAGIILVLLRDDLIPEHFKFDSDKIQLSAQGRLFADYTFDTVGAIYRALGLANSTELAGLLAYSVFLGVLCVAAHQSKGRVSSYRVLVFAIAAVLGGVYLGGFSKDVFVLAVVLLILVARPHLIWDLLIVGVIIWYGLNFRQYWLLVAAIYLAIRFGQREPRRVLWYLLVAASAVVVLSLALWFFLGVAPDSYRTSVNEIRGSVASSTLIEPFVHGPQPLVGIVNNVLTMLALIIPIPLLLRAELYYLAIAGMLLVIWGGFLRTAEKMGRGIVVHPRPFLARRAIALTFAFIAVEALFEPDYGSALRHLVPLLPLMLAASGYADEALHSRSKTKAERNEAWS